MGPSSYDLLTREMGWGRIIHIRTVSNQCRLFETSSGYFFVKTASNPARLEAEVKNLQLMASITTFRLPTIYFWNEDFLVLEGLDLYRHNHESAAECGRMIAKMHLTRTPNNFGLDYDNYIGGNLQPNQWSKNWIEFLTRFRLLPLVNTINDAEVTEKTEAVIADLPRLFEGIKVCPSLIHGDLWAGNMAALKDGTPVIYDPACYFAHAEADLAIAHIFGSIPETFFTAYHELIPKEPGYDERLRIYKLYHALNHYKIFGDCYRPLVLKMIEDPSS